MRPHLVRGPLDRSWTRWQNEIRVNLRPIWSGNQREVTEFPVTWRWGIQRQLKDLYVDRTFRDISSKLRQRASGIRATVTLLRKLPGAKQIPGHDMTLSAASQILDTMLTITQNQGHNQSNSEQAINQPKHPRCTDRRKGFLQHPIIFRQRFGV